MDPSAVSVQAAALPDSFYTILGVLLISNLGLIVTIVGAAFRLVYKWAVLETTVKALHSRVDELQGLEKKRRATDNEGTDET